MPCPFCIVICFPVIGLSVIRKTDVGKSNAIKQKYKYIKKIQGKIYQIPIPFLSFPQPLPLWSRRQRGRIAAGTIKAIYNAPLEAYRHEAGAAREPRPSDRTVSQTRISQDRSICQFPVLAFYVVSTHLEHLF